VIHLQMLDIEPQEHLLQLLPLPSSVFPSSFFF
jgi:hypothetical protein